MEVINPPGTLICPHCGHPNDARAFFCSNCGAPVGSKIQYRPDSRPYYYDGLPLISLLVTVFGFFVAGFIGPLFGVILAHISLHRIRRKGDDSNRGLAIASLVIGYFLLLVGLFILLALGAFVVTALFHNGWTGGSWSNI